MNMSHDEIREQHESIKNIEKQAYYITRGQIITWALILIGATASVVSAGWNYNNGVAKKSDIIILSKQIADLSSAFTKYKTEDSLDKLAIKDNANLTNTAVADIQKMCIRLNKNVVHWRVKDGKLAITP